MTRGRFLLFAILGLAGYAAFFLLFRHESPAARWDLRLDRRMAIERARELARQLGQNADAWPAWVSSNHEEEREAYLAQEARLPLGDRLTPVELQITMPDLSTGRHVIVRLNARGEPLGIEIREPGMPPRRRGPPQPGGNRPRGPRPPDHSATDASNLPADQKVAEAFAQALFGETLRQFPAAPTIGPQPAGNSFAWTASDDHMKFVLEALVRDGKLRFLQFEASPTEAFRNRLEAQQAGAILLFSNLVNVIIWPSLIALIIASVIGFARKEINHRRTLPFLAIAAGTLVALNFLGNFYDDFRAGFRVSASRPSFWLEMIIPPVAYLLLMVGLAGILYLYFAAGTTLTGDRPTRRTIDLELLLRGRLATRPVMESLLAGLLSAGLLCVLPHLAAVSRLFGPIKPDPSNLDDVLVCWSPVTESVLASSEFLVFLVFAFVAQLIEAFVPRKALATALLFAATALAFSSASYIDTPVSAAMATALLVAGLLTWLYSRFGVLAAFFAIMGNHLAFSAVALLAQPAPSLQASGGRAIGLLGFLLLLGALGRWKGRPATEDETAPIKPASNVRAERERLKAEFDIARKAQQQMLPDEAPAIPGFSIAAVCFPSREVGGDLYDFLRLPDGKIGLVVADVSGKGVPASLYMTLTKGLLDSVSEDKADPGEILREVNRHLYSVCQRKMFVTLFLGVLDPAQRTLTYARAGHNPTVFRSPADGRTVLLKPRGMGLGLNNGNIFDQSLRVEELRLQSRDKLLFYSDGITEAMNPANDEYGEERLMELAARLDDLSAEQARDAILEDVREFLADNPPQDDQTLVVLQVL